jgi:UDPglucose 6-dehydrogenase
LISKNLKALEFGEFSLKHKIAVVGAGYVGLIQAVGLASLSFDVVCIDVDPKKIVSLSLGVPPIYEEGLQELLQRVLAAGKLRFSNSINDAAECDLFFVAVGTPSDPNTGNANLTYLFSAVAAVAEVASKGAAIVIKSTVPIGTCERLQDMLNRSSESYGLNVISNPEFLREGCALEDFFQPERIVIGGQDPDAVSAVTLVYKYFSDKGVPFVTGDWISCEVIKYAANAFLATKLTFINEISNLTEAIGGDIEKIALGIGLDSRIGAKFLKVGPGYGGSCFPKDTLALATTARRHGVQQQILEAVISENDNRRFKILQRLQKILGESLAGKSIAILGVAFKANTDDIRDSPAIGLTHLLLSESVEVRTFDPMAKLIVDHPNYQQFDTIEDAVTGCDMILIVTEWPEFAKLDFNNLATLVKQCNIYDLRMVLRDRVTELADWNINFVGLKLKNDKY